MFKFNFGEQINFVILPVKCSIILFLREKTNPVLIAGLQTGVQHVEPPDPQKELKLSSLGLQLQPEAGEDPHHQGEKEE